MFGLSSILAAMKRFIAIFTAMIISISSGSAVPVGSILARGVAPYLLSVPSYSFYDPTVKIPKTGALEKTAEYTLYAAKNEHEYCQIALQVRDERGGSFVKLTDFTNENGDVLKTEFCEEDYIKTSGETVFGSYPDALIPVGTNTDYKLRMLEAVNYPFYIGIRTDKDTVPGDYTATLTLRCTDSDSKYERLELTVKAHIWDFELPDSPAMDTAMGLDKTCIAKTHGVDPSSAEATELYKTYYEFMLDHKISPYNLPVDILSDEADAYMSDPRCTSFTIPYAGDDTIRAYAEKLGSNPEWAAKGYFYPIDEPSDEDAYARYTAISDRLASLYPDYHMVTPFYVNRVDINGESDLGVELQDGRSDIICPISSLFDEKDMYEAAQRRQANGDKLWWYVCCGPGPKTDYCNLFVQQDGIKHRLLFWQQKQLGVTGLLYWDVNYWYDVGFDPWSSAWTTPWTGPDTFGDGSLIYDGAHLGLSSPVSSLRLEAVTNGIEDYEYLTIAQERLGTDYMNKIISKLTKNLTSYTLSDAQFAKVRIELGNAIEKAVG